MIFTIIYVNGEGIIDIINDDIPFFTIEDAFSVRTSVYAVGCDGHLSIPIVKGDTLLSIYAGICHHHRGFDFLVFFAQMHHDKVNAIYPHIQKSTARQFRANDSLHMGNRIGKITGHGLNLPNNS